MAFKYIALLALVSAVAAIANDAYNHQEYYEEHHQPAHYEFEYSVHDEHTGDIKSQKETRKDDQVVGFYTLVEPDGHRRIVHYTADKHSGFNAKVEREEVKGYQAPQQQHSTHYAAPQVHKIISVAPQAHYNDQSAKTYSSFSSGNSGHYSSNNYHN